MLFADVHEIEDAHHGEVSRIGEAASDRVFHRNPEKVGVSEDAAVELDVGSLPAMLRNSIKELEGYDEANDPLFHDAADTMLLMAERFLAEGVIDQKTYDLLARKYPIA